MVILLSWCTHGCYVSSRGAFHFYFFLYLSSWAISHKIGGKNSKIRRYGNKEKSRTAPAIRGSSNAARCLFRFSSGLSAVRVSDRLLAAWALFALFFGDILVRYDNPVPGMLAVNAPRLFHVRPRPPTEVLSPDLLMLMRTPGAILIDRLNRRFISTGPRVCGAHSMFLLLWIVCLARELSQCEVAAFCWAASAPEVVRPAGKGWGTVSV